MGSSNPMFTLCSAATWRFMLRLIGCLCLLFTTAGVVVIGLGRLSPLSNRATTFGLGWCGGQPCFRGVTPGLTSWAEAQQAFGNRRIIPIDAPDGEIKLYSSSKREALGRIQIRLPDDGSLSARDVISLYGSPCGVTIYPQTSQFTLHYPTLRFSTPYNQDGLKLNTPIVVIEFRDPAYPRKVGSAACMEQPIIDGLEKIYRRWNGFIAAQQYLARP